MARLPVAGVVFGFAVVGWLLADAGPAIAQIGERHSPDSDRVVARAVSLLPTRPPAIVVVDFDRLAALVRPTVADAEGFVTVGKTTIFLNRQGSTFRQALKGPGICDYVLAIIIWHEMAHLAGADEREARRQEEALWSEFVVSRKVDSDLGLNYLRLLRARH